MHYFAVLLIAALGGFLASAIIDLARKGLPKGGL